MPKVIEILERYVQWIALGLAILFVGLMAYTYIVNPPLTANIGSKQLAPGEVDAYIASSSLAQLKNGIASKTPLVYTQTDPKQKFLTDINWDVNVPPIAGTRVRTPTTGPGPVSTGVATAVQPPAPTFLDKTVGRSVLAIPNPNAAPAPAAPRPGFPAPAAAAAAAPDLQDKDWVTLAFRLDMAALDKAFQAANIPPSPEIYRTEFLHVDLERQQLLPDGKTWTKEVVVPPLRPHELQPMPASGAPVSAQAQYMIWAGQHEAEIVQPSFLETVGRGTPWTMPPLAAPAGAPGMRSPPPGFIVPPPRGARAAPAEGGPVKEVMLLAAPTTPRPPRTPRGGTPTSPPLPPPPPIVPMSPPPANPGAAAPPQPTQLQANPIPTAQSLPGVAQAGGVAGAQPGVFNPGQVALQQPTINIIAHDVDVDASKTYRYRLRYMILNPMWTSDQAPAALKHQLAIASPYSDWSPPIEIGARVRFWVARVAKAQGTARFDVFVDQAGGQKKVTMDVNIGDAIGDSGSTLVDIRDDGRGHAWALVSDANGHITKHDPRIDAKDADYERLNAATGGAAPAGGGPGGAPPAGSPGGA